MYTRKKKKYSLPRLCISSLYQKVSRLDRWWNTNSFSLLRCCSRLNKYSGIKPSMPLSSFWLLERKYIESFAEQIASWQVLTQSKAVHDVRMADSWLLNTKHCPLFKDEVKVLLVICRSNSSNNCKQRNFGNSSKNSIYGLSSSGLPRSTASFFIREHM